MPALSGPALPNLEGSEPRPRCPSPSRSTFSHRLSAANSFRDMSALSSRGSTRIPRRVASAARSFPRAQRSSVHMCTRGFPNCYRLHHSAPCLAKRRRSGCHLAGPVTWQSCNFSRLQSANLPSDFCALWIEISSRELRCYEGWRIPVFWNLGSWCFPSPDICLKYQPFYIFVWNMFSQSLRH